MAVDANILIFERIKEEIKLKPLKEAILSGFERAWNSIRDGNMSTILVAVVLFYLTTPIIKGFAVTFGIGVIVSMLTAIAVTRGFLLTVSVFSKDKDFGEKMFKFNKK